MTCIPCLRVVRLSDGVPLGVRSFRYYEVLTKCFCVYVLMKEKILCNFFWRVCRCGVI